MNNLKEIEAAVERRNGIAWRIVERTRFLLSDESVGDEKSAEVQRARLRELIDECDVLDEFIRQALGVPQFVLPQPAKATA